ncbi:hypothetical protein SmJEL517_g04138 [Synchytrium microbalum]|uniref:Uncharacterized protein n=1 Tax=Synchytrium microbalum TaxID=1806994 RepID=A0A507C5I9_9FUNG|nr:uncharacterized protein SmJEL517_g04138 [Synchytrium microbalum]TPX32813.1 hypothetical protein SmJEL517_g04138 [Synchytrium microbalum]
MTGNSTANYSYATFFCGTCEQPIRLDSSLLEHQSLEDATGKSFKCFAPLLDQARSFRNLRSTTLRPTRRVLPPEISTSSLERRTTGTNNNNNSAMWRTGVPVQDSFVMLSRSQVNATPSASASSSNLPLQQQDSSQQRGNLSHRLKTAGKLFDLISGVSQVDHPLCQDCADELTIMLEKRLSEVRKERDVYSAYLDKLEVDRESGSEDNKITEHDLAALKEREDQSLRVLKELEDEKVHLKHELELLEAELHELDHLEACYWQDVNEYETELREFQDERDSIQMRQEHTDRQLQNLRRTNVINDTFRIWHDGPFGTINGFRLGRLPSIPVDWSEINAALGQVLLLMDTLTNRLSFTFKTYRLVPMGNFSRIEKIEGDKASYELYGSGDIASVLFYNRRFDIALIALLNCLQQLCELVEHDGAFKLPYRISKDKIGDTSIRHSNLDDTWTKALKFVLINLKWVLAYAWNCDYAVLWTDVLPSLEIANAFASFASSLSAQDDSRFINNAFMVTSALIGAGCGMGQRQATLEGIRMVLSSNGGSDILCDLVGCGISWRANAQKNVIVLTDGDSDLPTNVNYRMTNQSPSTSMCWGSYLYTRDISGNLVENGCSSNLQYEPKWTGSMAFMDSLTSGGPIPTYYRTDSGPISLQQSWYDEIAATAKLIVQNGAIVHLLMQPASDTSSVPALFAPRSQFNGYNEYFRKIGAQTTSANNTQVLQFGDPAVQSMDSDYLNFNPKLTNQNLASVGLNSSLQSSVLSMGGLLRLFNIGDLTTSSTGASRFLNAALSTSLTCSSDNTIYSPPAPSPNPSAIASAASSVAPSPVVTSANPNILASTIVLNSVLPSPVPSTVMASVLPSPIPSTVMSSVLPSPIPSTVMASVLPSPIPSTVMTSVLPSPIPSTVMTSVLPSPIPSTVRTSVLPSLISSAVMTSVLPSPIPSTVRTSVLPSPIPSTVMPSPLLASAKPSIVPSTLVYPSPMTRVSAASAPSSPTPASPSPMSTSVLADSVVIPSSIPATSSSPDASPTPEPSGANVVPIAIGGALGAASIFGASIIYRRSRHHLPGAGGVSAGPARLSTNGHNPLYEGLSSLSENPLYEDPLRKMDFFSSSFADLA